MCVHITPARPTAVQRMTGLEPVQDYLAESFPGYAAPIIRADAGAASGLKVDLALFGLIPGWSKDRNIGRRTYNARTETVADKPSYRTAWRQRQFCLVPVERFFEPCWETGKAVQWSIQRQDGESFTVAAIWDRWTERATGEIVVSFSMLTINADEHPIMGRFHKPGDERRSLVVVPLSKWSEWLGSVPSNAMAMMQLMSHLEYVTKPAEIQPLQVSIF